MGGETSVSQSIFLSHLDADVTGFADGGFAVTWAAGSDIYARVFDADGPTGPEFIANDQTPGTQNEPEIVELSNGNVLIAWSSSTSFGAGDGNSIGVIGRLFNADGTPVSATDGSDDIVLNTTILGVQNSVAIAANGSGGFVAVWNDGTVNDVRFQRFDDAGDPVGGEIIITDVDAGVSGGAPEVTELSDGGFIVVWEDGDGSARGIFQQQFDASGVAVGDIAQVNEFVFSNQFIPEVSATPAGGWFVTRSSTATQDGSGSGIIGREFASDGTPLGEEIIVNEITEGGQTDADVTTLADGRLAVVWTGLDSVGQGSLALVRIDVLPASGQLELSGSPLSGGEEITAAQLSSGALSYVPADDVNGFDSFFFSGSTDGTTFTLIESEATIEITPVNDAVDLAEQTDLVIEESNFTNLSIPLTIGDPDNANTYTVTVDYGEGDPAQVFNTGNQMPFIQNVYEEEGTFTVLVSVDDNAGSVEGISFDVTVNNAPPNAVNDFFLTDEDTPLAGTPNILNNDRDQAGDTFEITAINGVAYTPGEDLVLPSGATINVADDGAFSYDPTTSASLQAQTDSQFTDDSFVYTITDEDGAIDTATATVRVTGEDDFEAQDDEMTVDEDSTLTGSLFADNGNGADTDPEGDAITISAVNGNAALVGAPVVLFGGGILNVAADGTFSFAAGGQYDELADGESRIISFTYDAVEAGENGAADATATITIPGINDAPVAGDDLINVGFETATGEVSILGNDFDVEGDDLVIAIIEDPVNGSVQVIDETRIIFTPDDDFSGDEVVSYTVSDGNGGTDTGEVTFRVADQDNVAPVAVDDVFSATEDMQATFNVLGNDADANGDILSIPFVSQPVGGSTAVSGNQVVFTPDADFNGARPTRDSKLPNREHL